MAKTGFAGAAFCSPNGNRSSRCKRQLDVYLTGEIAKTFRRQNELSWLPLPLRRFVWWMNLNTLGPKRSRRIGTFSISTLAGQGAWNRFHPSIHATSLTYGPLNDRGEAVVTLICDHRVLDGMLAAQVITRLEAALCGPIARELASLAEARGGVKLFPLADIQRGVRSIRPLAHAFGSVQADSPEGRHNTH